ncbi:MAG: Mu-like prophage major head subunit gpT family protein [Pseudomonadota bacterium]
MSFANALKPSPARDRAGVIIMAAEAGMERAEATAFADAFPSKDAAKTELRRRDQITTAADKASLPEMAEGLVAEGVSVEAARARIFEAWVDQDAASPGPRIDTRQRWYGDERMQFRHQAVDAIVAKVGGKQSDSPYAGASLRDIAMATLRLHGHPLGVNERSAVEMALSTTSDYPLILGGAVSRLLSDGYALAMPEIARASRVMSATDFRRQPILRLSSGSALEKVNEGGEVTSAYLSEEGEAIQIATFAKIYGLSRHAIVNDDLGAFDALPQKGAEGSAQTMRTVLCGLLTANSGDGVTMRDATPLFDVSHGNLAATGASLSIATLSAAVTAIRRQVGQNNEVLAITPRFILVPPELETPARQVVTEITAESVAEVNPFANRLEVLVEPGLSDPNAWYVIGDPNRSEGIAHAYLDGSNGPTISMREGFEIEGMEWKVRMDFGATMLDWRSIYKNPGA